jgi:hypothetical protein
MEDLEQAITDLIAIRRRKGNDSDIVEVPIIGEVYTVEDVESVKRRITLAIVAQIRWDIEKPPSLPALPLSLAQIRALMSLGDIWRHLTCLVRLFVAQGRLGPRASPVRRIHCRTARLTAGSLVFEKRRGIKQGQAQAAGNARRRNVLLEPETTVDKTKDRGTPSGLGARKSGASVTG